MALLVLVAGVVGCSGSPSESSSGPDSGAGSGSGDDGPDAAAVEDCEDRGDCPPQILSAAPSLVPSNTAATVSIVGAHFAEGATVLLGGVPISPVIFVDEGELSITVGAAPGQYGDLDLQVSNPDGQSAMLAEALRRFLGAVGFGERTNTLADGGAISVATGDLNGDGNVDVVTANVAAGSVAILLGRGDGTFDEAAIRSVGSGAATVRLVDLDTDGALDIVVTARDDDSLVTLAGNGDGTFAPEVVYAAGDGVFGLAVGDVNGDLASDIVTGHQLGDNIGVRLGDGSGGLGPMTTLPGNDFVFGVELADMDSDGNLDIVATSGIGPGLVSVYRGNGDGTFAPKADADLGASPRRLAVADIDGDGRADVVAPNVDDGTISVALGTGDGQLGAATTVVSGFSPFAVDVTDLNKDGRPDLLAVRLSTSNALEYHLGLGDGTFTTRQIVGTTSNGPRDIEAADLDGDGLPDLVTANRQSNNVTSVLNASE